MFDPDKPGPEGHNAGITPGWSKTPTFDERLQRAEERIDQLLALFERVEKLVTVATAAEVRVLLAKAEAENRRLRGELATNTKGKR